MQLLFSPTSGLERNDGAYDVPNGSQAPANRRKPEELRSRGQGDAVRPPALTKCLLSSSRSLQRQHHGHHHKKGNIYPLVGPSGYPAVCPYICTV